MNRYLNKTFAGMAHMQTSMRNPTGFFTVDNPDGKTVPKTLIPYANGYVVRALCASGHVLEALGHLKSEWSLQLTSEVGRVKVEPGDLVFGDVDGVVVVPQNLEKEVIAQALKKATGENMVRKDIENGMTNTAAFEKYGIL